MRKPSEGNAATIARRSSLSPADYCAADETSEQAWLHGNWAIAMALRKR
ncbi:MAG: hypothetical protein ABSC23_14570 [Bryobacteraceae bacterium]